MAQDEKCPNADIFGPNTGEYGPEKTPHLDTNLLIYYQQIRDNTL